MTPCSCHKTIPKGSQFALNLVPKASRTTRPVCRVYVASMDDYDSGDESLRHEFAKIRSKADPQAAVRIVEHLNLLWSVSEVRTTGALGPRCFMNIGFLLIVTLNLVQRKKPEMCGCCHGKGQKECSWCHGTGAMTLGDTLFCSDQGCRPCPVCAGSVCDVFRETWEIHDS